MKENNTYISPVINILELYFEGSILTGSNVDVGVKDWEDVEIC